MLNKPVEIDPKMIYGQLPVIRRISFTGRVFMKMRFISFAVSITAFAAHAQIGQGWIPVTPKRAIQVETHGKYTDYSYTKTFVAEAGAS